MPPTSPVRKNRRKLASTTDADYERRIQEALEGLHSGRFAGVVQASRVMRLRIGKGSRAIAASKQQLLTPEQEQVLVDWCNLRSSAATPNHPRDIAAQAFQISGKMPGIHWAERFLTRHSDKLVLAKSHHVDPKRAENFNEDTITHYFNLREETETKFGPFPPEHNWNLDEKGSQNGGGRKGDGQKFIFSVEDKDRYRQHSDSYNN
ncbi:hypothetical protein H0H81_007423 [Sphagnurus paluster]|uniref:HTH CENPB-type domain-containing protein n=1 Tax=Sphagnurus paluster TaxID=117069 RepID=A0A9P7GL39_9AGAR|nr:hypothetical protein H0H81_007423 [Sphagnurus paluster]